MVAHRRIPRAHAVVEAREALPRVGHVRRDHVARVQLERDRAPLVELANRIELDAHNVEARLDEHHHAAARSTRGAVGRRACAGALSSQPIQYPARPARPVELPPRAHLYPFFTVHMAQCAL